MKASVLSPTSGRAGSTVTVRGSGFGAAQGSNTLTFDGQPVTPVAWADDSITFSVPAISPKSAEVCVNKTTVGHFSVVE